MARAVPSTFLIWQVAREAAGALSVLATNSPENREMIARAEGVKPLIELLGYDETAAAAAGALHNIAFNNEGVKGEVTELGGIPKLLKLMAGGERAAQEQA